MIEDRKETGCRRAATARVRGRRRAREPARQLPLFNDTRSGRFPHPPRTPPPQVAAALKFWKSHFAALQFRSVRCLRRPTRGERRAVGAAAVREAVAFAAPCVAARHSLQKPSCTPEEAIQLTALRREGAQVVGGGSGGKASPGGRFKAPLGLLLNLILLVGPQLNLQPHLGSLWLTSLIAAGALLVLYKLLSFPRWQDETRHAPRFAAAVAFLLGVVVLENFCTWATSASDLRKHDYQPLQDNAEIALRWALQRYPVAGRAVLGWRVDMHFLLYSFVALCLSVLWDQVPYSGFGMGARFMETIAWAHLIRTFAFMTTVLPNPRPHCYARSFPPVPADWREFVAIGFSAKRGSGCNDLVVSGHGVVYAAVPLALASYHPLPAWRGGAAAVGWAAVAKLCLQETLDKTHYSVDMLLAVVLTALVWHWRAPAHPPADAWAPRPAGAAPDPAPKGLVALVVGVLVLVFVGVAGT